MTRPIFASVADDDTGATDLAGMLAEQGLRTVLLIDVPADREFACWAAGHDAVVIGTGTRALAPREAYNRTRSAIQRLRTLEPDVLEIKYCSTFDSTPEGNIGPSIDAAMDELGSDFTVALPALPVNGRTTYMGHHFVHNQLLSDSPMRHHPLNPMTNANLVSHLQSQTKRKVGLAKFPVSKDQLDRLRSEGVRIAILDCVSDGDLESVCEAIADLRLISGSSAPAMKLPAIWERTREWSPAGIAMPRPGAAGRGYLVVAGSCSVATRAQNDCLESQGALTVALDALELLNGDAEPGWEPIAGELASGRVCLLRTASSPDDVRRVQNLARARGRDENSVGLEIAYAVARIVRRIMEQSTPAGLIVAGGETSGAVCRTLELGALEVGRNIEPGVPICMSLGRFRLPVVLKSGNFGSPDFYSRSIAACEQLQ